MIPIAQITQWRQFSPWADDLQVEQDLILSRIIIEIFSDPLLKQELAFRGGTALHKLFFSPAARYSEDIDLVRTSGGPITTIIDRLRTRLDPLLGEPKRERKERGFKLFYYFNPETSNQSKQKIKIEINTREIFSATDRILHKYSIESDWFSGSTEVNTFQFEELIATKLRALYQRKKGRDLFDLWLALHQINFNIKKTIDIFIQYMQIENHTISRELFEKNLNEKLENSSFLDDIKPLLRAEQDWNLADAAEEVRNKILMELP